MRFFSALVLCCVASASAAQENAAPAIEELKRELATRDRIIRNLIERIERLEAVLGNSPESSQTANPSEELTEKDAEQQAADVERIRAAFERTLIERGGLTLPKWRWEIDTGINYGHSSSEALTIDGFTVYPVLIVGDIVSERVRRDTFTAAASARIGLPYSVQADVRVPYFYENSSRLSAAGEERTLSDDGVGDVELGLTRPLWHARGAGVDFLGALRWKATTGEDPFGLAENRIPFGTGFHAISASITAVTAQDPMVFFGTLSYGNNLSARKGANRIDPGDSYGLQLGAALAVNLNTSLSFGLQQQYTTRTRIDGADLAGSYINTSSFSINISHALESGRTFDTGLVIGLSEDSPDFQLNFSMPFRRATK